jgi:hypothetical protein
MNENTAYFRALHDIAQQIVADPRNVDADLAAALKSATMELAARYSNPQYALEQLYSAETELGADLRQAFAIVGTDEIAKARPRDSAAGAHGLAAALSEHLIDRLADLRRKHGFEKTAKESPMDRTQELRDIGIAAVAKTIVSEQRSYGIDEHEFTKLATEEASRRWPGMRPDAAFSKLFSDSGADGVMLRKAHNVVKANPFNSLDATNKANDELMVKAAELRKTQPQLSEAQAFSKVFTDPANIELASKAHRRPSPTTSYEFPR